MHRVSTAKWNNTIKTKSKGNQQNKRRETAGIVSTSVKTGPYSSKNYGKQKYKEPGLEIVEKIVETKAFVIGS